MNFVPVLGKHGSTPVLHLSPYGTHCCMARKTLFSEVAYNFHLINQTMAPLLVPITTLYLEEMEEKGHRGFPLLIFTRGFEKDNIHSTRKMHLRGGNHQVIQNFYFKAIKG